MRVLPVRRTSSKGLVSLKQLSQTSFTARSADSLSGQLGFAMTDITARLRTHVFDMVLVLA
jgi:hypothetical protein